MSKANDHAYAKMTQFEKPTLSWVLVNQEPHEAELAVKAPSFVRPPKIQELSVSH